MILHNEPTQRAWWRDITIRLIAADGVTVVVQSPVLNPKNSLGEGELNFDNGPSQLVFSFPLSQGEPPIGRYPRVVALAMHVGSEPCGHVASWPRLSVRLPLCADDRRGGSLRTKCPRQGVRSRIVARARARVVFPLTMVSSLGFVTTGEIIMGNVSLRVRALGFKIFIGHLVLMAAPAELC